MNFHRNLIQPFLQHETFHSFTAPGGVPGVPQDRMPIRCKLRFMVNAAMGMVRRSVRKRTSDKDMETE